ncbi:hypothetical protein CDD83_2258 [Cordyceps sp. RAO-2017]|nr:hypothetical protein CDD83_2258 [Cordyceps sp. RAO-2017]
MAVSACGWECYRYLERDNRPNGRWIAYWTVRLALAEFTVQYKRWMIGEQGTKLSQRDWLVLLPPKNGRRPVKPPPLQGMAPLGRQPRLRRATPGYDPRGRDGRPAPSPNAFSMSLPPRMRLRRYEALYVGAMPAITASHMADREAGFRGRTSHTILLEFEVRQRGIAEASYKPYFFRGAPK